MIEEVRVDLRDPKIGIMDARIVLKRFQNVLQLEHALPECIEELSGHASSVSAGTRIVHPVRGPGLVTMVVDDDPRDHPVHVLFDSGEEHHYTKQSACKLEVRAPSEQPTAAGAL